MGDDLVLKAEARESGGDHAGHPRPEHPAEGRVVGRGLRREGERAVVEQERGDDPQASTDPPNSDQPTLGPTRIPAPIIMGDMLIPILIATRVIPRMPAVTQPKSSRERFS